MWVVFIPTHTSTQRGLLSIHEFSQALGSKIDLSKAPSTSQRQGLNIIWPSRSVKTNQHSKGGPKMGSTYMANIHRSREGTLRNLSLDLKFTKFTQCWRPLISDCRVLDKACCSDPPILHPHTYLQTCNTTSCCNYPCSPIHKGKTSGRVR
jgi:hypothetical protein